MFDGLDRGLTIVGVQNKQTNKQPNKNGRTNVLITHRQKSDKETNQRIIQEINQKIKRR